MESAYPLIKQIENEFAEHLTKGSGQLFSPSSEVSDRLRKLERALESRASSGELTAAEEQCLKDTAELWKKIAIWNGQVLAKPNSQTSPQVYNLKNQTLADEDAVQNPFFVPKLSEEQVDKIILHLNEQFEEKVLKQIRGKPALAQRFSVAAPVPDFSLGSTAPAGRNLEDYLAIMQDARSSAPFSDPDSNIYLKEVPRSTV